jgi:PAS domain S-box-containing protein
MDKKEIKILAIDDNLDNLITIQALTSDSFPNANIIIALNGEEGLELAAKENPDVILLDIIMPGMDGFEVCERLKSDSNLCDIPVIFVTALKGDKQSRIRGLEVGGEAFLAKPIDESELVAQLRAMIKIASINIEKRTENVRLSQLVEEKVKELTLSHTATLNLLEDLKEENEARRKSESALRESEEKYRFMTENISDVLWHMNSEFCFDYVSPSIEQMQGFKPEELIGKPLFWLLNEEGTKQIENEISKVTDKMKSGKLEPEMKFEYQSRCKNGDWIWVEVNVSIQLNDEMEPAGFQGVTRDITKRKKIEDALRNSEEKFRNMANLLPQVVFELDLRGNITYVNQQVKDIFGYTEDEMIGQNSLMVHLPKDSERVIRNLRLKVDENFQDKEYKMVRKDGTTFPALIYTDVIYAENRPTGFRGLVVDISERIKTEERLRESEEKFREMANLLPQIVFETDIHGNLTYVNQQAYKMLGHNHDEEYFGKNAKTYFIQKDVKKLMLNIAGKLNGRIEGSNQYTLVREDGVEIPVIVYSSAIIKDGKPIGIRGIIIDITEQKQAENKIRESEAKYFNLYSLFRLMSDTMPDMMWAKDLEGKFTFVNKSFCDNLLIANDTLEPLGKTASYFTDRERKTHPDNPYWHTFGDSCAISDHETLTKRKTKQYDEFGTVKGEFIFLDVHKAPLFNASKELVGIVGTARDITVKKRIEKELESSRNVLQTIYDNAPIMMCVVNEAAQIQFANRAFANMAKVSESELVGGAVGGIIGCIKSLDDPRGCGFGPKCKSCTLRSAMTKTLKHNQIQTNVEYHSNVHTADGVKPISLLASTAAINTKDQKNLLLCLIDITDRKLSEEALQKSEALLRSFIDNSPFEIWARDVNSIGILENKKIEEHYGSIIGITPTTDNRVNKEIVKRWVSVNNRVFSGEIVDEEFKDEVFGSERIFQQIAFPIKNKDISIGIAGFNIDITERKSVEMALKESQEQLKKFAAHLQNVREEERNLLARDIHDDLGQILIAMKIDLGLLKQNVSKTLDALQFESIKSRFDDLQKLVDNTLKSARRIMTDLRPEVLDLLGFIETVNQHLKGFEERTKIECNFFNNPVNLDLTNEQSVALFRIVQESLNNTAKHALATKVNVLLNKDADGLILEINDNGVGFDIKDKKKIDSYGLMGIKERVFLLGGELIINSTKNVGTSIKVILGKQNLIIKS